VPQWKRRVLHGLELACDAAEDRDLEKLAARLVVEQRHLPALLQVGDLSLDVRVQVGAVPSA
jgi:hypothetical protein